MTCEFCKDLPISVITEMLAMLSNDNLKRNNFEGRMRGTDFVIYRPLQKVALVCPQKFSTLAAFFGLRTGRRPMGRQEMCGQEMDGGE